jgi:hypothetical protein
MSATVQCDIVRTPGERRTNAGGDRDQTGPVVPDEVAHFGWCVGVVGSGFGEASGRRALLKGVRGRTCD